jgi:hypothetical protein
VRALDLMPIGIALLLTGCESFEFKRGKLAQCDLDCQHYGYQGAIIMDECHCDTQYRKLSNVMAQSSERAAR